MITSRNRRAVSVTLVKFSEIERESPLEITLVQGISRGERMDYTVQKAVELGVRRIVPLKSLRTMVRLPQDRIERRLEHWRGVIHHACEQCGRNRVPSLAPIQSLDQILAAESFGQGDSPMLRYMRESLTRGEANRTGTLPYAVNEREAREATALTYGMITLVDDAIGQVCSTLQTTGLAENTVLVFTTDHGDFMGDHGIMLKGPLHYRGLIRVPLIWSDPGAESEPVVNSLAQSIDIPATFLERSGIQPYYGMQGTGLVRTIYDRQPDARDALLIEDDRELIYLGFDCPQRVRTVVTQTARLTVYQPAEWGELYDFAADPLEVTNLWNDPAHQELQAMMTARLLELVIGFQDWAPLPTGRA